MKKMLLTGICLLSGAVFMLASTGEVRSASNLSKELKKSEIKKDKSTCSVTCSRTFDFQGGTYTVTVSAGNIFSSCERATTRCQNKLEEALQ